MKQNQSKPRKIAHRLHRDAEPPALARRWQRLLREAAGDDARVERIERERDSLATVVQPTKGTKLSDLAVTHRREIAAMRAALPLIDSLEDIDRAFGLAAPLRSALAPVRARFTRALERHDRQVALTQRKVGQPPGALANVVRAAAEAVDGGAHIRAVVAFILDDIGPRLPYFVRQAGRVDSTGAVTVDDQARTLTARIKQKHQRARKTKPAKRA